ncbi:hypothetical protein MTQ01_13225 [Streptomyces sp. XM4193]|uniref:hypothetical protein n=1 Tax=Streptomyces sp. XM4193 TaxID=2929782 RepID=UPI001FF92941|nr:hypothetical protein [Streptomyces sp. XM4193]MCK1796959.1 hypothetical protein [Streptomyces sp. XM4193]
MGIRRASLAGLLAAGLVLTASACDAADNERADTGSSAGADSSSDADDKGSDDSAEAALPNLVDRGLDSARKAAGDAGFRKLKTHDALGRDRAQAFTRNWQVCFQSPAAGTHPTSTEVDLGAVKLDEECPEKDQRPEKAGATMPDFSGKSLRAARGALDETSGISTEDATGEKRLIVLESNWRVCTQKPAAGEALEGRPVSFTAVKFGETCP